MIGRYDRRRKESLFLPVIHYNRLLWLDGHRRPHCKGIINNDRARLLVLENHNVLALLGRVSYPAVKTFETLLQIVYSQWSNNTCYTVELKTCFYNCPSDNSQPVWGFFSPDFKSLRFLSSDTCTLVRKWMTVDKNWKKWIKWMNRDDIGWK